MISEQMKEKLKHNWGEKADALHCFCEVKIQEPAGRWECYIYAINPEDEDQCMGIMKFNTMVSAQEWSIQDLMHTYNYKGEYPIIDKEFRRRKADVLYKKLGGV